MDSEKGLTKTMSVALLMFNLSEPEGILRNLRSMQGVVDEIVIVDSSPPAEHETLLRLMSPYSVRVFHVLPLGFPEPLRPFGTSKVESDYALVLDADEEPSERLKADLRKLNTDDAYVLPRFEEQLRSYTFHLRLFRPTAVRYRKRSFDFPDVDGRIGHLGKSHRIVHHANYRGYLDDKSRGERYFTIENIERPFNRRYLHDALTLRFWGRSVSVPFAARLQDRPDAPLSSPATRGVVEMEFLRDLLMGKGLRAASFNRRYSFRKWRFFVKLPDSDQSFLRALAQDIQHSGGLFAYLGVDNPTYLEKLTGSFHWDLRGIDVYRSLLRYRLLHQRPADSVPTDQNDVG